MILQIAAYFILASRKKGSFCYGSIYGGAIFIDRTTKYNHCLVTSTSTGMFVFESRNDSFNGIQNDGFTPIFSGFRHADRLINYVIYATFRMEVLYYAMMGKVALLLQKIENREPITVGIGE